MRTCSRPTALAVLAALLLLAGCDSGNGGDGGDAPAPRPPSSAEGPGASPSGAPRPGHPGAKNGTDASACFDGTCEILVSQPIRLHVDKRFGVSDVIVTEIGETSVSVQGRGSDGTLLSNSIGEGGQGTLNRLQFTVESLRGGAAVLSFSPRR